MVKWLPTTLIVGGLDAILATGCRHDTLAVFVFAVPPRCVCVVVTPLPLVPDVALLVLDLPVLGLVQVTWPEASRVQFFAATAGAAKSINASVQVVVFISIGQVPLRVRAQGADRSSTLAQ
jgi:hypothetical protein